MVITESVLLCLASVLEYFSPKSQHVREDFSLRLVPATSHGEQVPSCELPILVKKCSRRDQNLVSATSPTNSNWFKFVGPVPGTSPTNYAWSLRVNCLWDKSLRPMKTFHQLFCLFFPVGLENKSCICLYWHRQPKLTMRGAHILTCSILHIL